ncbi:MAG: type IV pilus assembly protein PilM [bacterium]
MFGKKSFPLAIDIGSHAVKLVQLGRNKKKGLVLARLGMASLGHGAFVDGEVREPEEVMRAVEELVAAEKTKEKKIAVGISGLSAVVKTILVPPAEGAALDEAVEIEASQILPFPIDDVRLRRRRLRQVEVDGDTMDEYLIVAVKKKSIGDTIDLLKHLKFEPTHVDINLLAIESAFELSGVDEDGEPTALVDIGASETLIHIIQGSRTLMTRTLPLGGGTVTETIGKSLDVTRLEAEGIKMGTRPSPSPRAVADAIRSEVERLARELGRTFQMHVQLHPEDQIHRMVLSGGGAHLDGLPAYLAASLDVPVEFAQPFRKVEVPTDTFDPDFIENLGPIAAAGAGLAYRAME